MSCKVSDNKVHTVEEGEYIHEEGWFVEPVWVEVPGAKGHGSLHEVELASVVGKREIVGQAPNSEEKSKPQDAQKCKASPTLLLHCCEGKAIPSGILTVQRAGPDKVKALELEIEQIIVTSYVPSGSGEPGNEIPMETVTLSFKYFMFKYTPQLEDSTADAVIEQGWNVVENQAA